MSASDDSREPGPFAPAQQRPRGRRLQRRGIALPPLLDALPDAVLLVDPAGARPWRVVACNRAATVLYGLPRDRLLGWHAAHIPAALEQAAAGGGAAEHLRRVGVERVEAICRTPEYGGVAVEAALSLLTLGGREYVVSVERDTTARRNAEAELRRRTAVNRCASTIARQLSEAEGEAIDGVIEQVLATIGTFLDTDRVRVLLYAPEQAALSASYAWRGGLGGGPSGPATLMLAQLPWLAARVARQQLIQISDLAALPGEATAERAALAAQGICALLATPIVRDGAVRGLLCAESTRHPRSWTSEEIGLLLQAADSLAQTIERRHAALDLLSATARYRVLTDHTADVISLHDAGGRFTYCSPAALAAFGYRPDELLGNTPAQLIHPEDLPDILLRGKVHDTGAITTVYRIRHQDGYYLWVETSARAVCDPHSGAIREIVAVTRDIDARKSYEAKIERLAYYDPLTGLANRRFLHDQLARTLGEAGQPGTATALLYLDLDRFKTVNDTLGHDAGDELLLQVAARLRGQVSEGATFARLGGDEFAVLLPNIAKYGAAVDLARQIVDQIKLPFTVRGQSIHLGVSVGIALAPQNRLRPEDMLKHADIAMYQAKLEGDSYRFYNPEGNPHLQRRLRIEAELRAALEADELELHYQPIRRLDDDAVYAVEALVRWPQPDGSLLTPGEFIPLAEETSLISILDRWVIRRALLQLRAWERQGWRPRISVNLSPRTIHDRSLVAYFVGCLEDAGVAAERVIVEVTESAIMRDPATMGEVLSQLRALGAQVALDDFGSGYAALHTVKQLPIDILKIDRSFVQGIGASPRDEGILRAIIMIGAAIGALVVAEGVRNQAHRAWLSAAGCRYVQGFGVGMPQRAEEVFRGRGA